MPGYDPLVQAAGGDPQPDRRGGVASGVRVGVSMVDQGNWGLGRAGESSAALHEREWTGAGRTIDRLALRDDAGAALVPGHRLTWGAAERSRGCTERRSRLHRSLTVCLRHGWDGEVMIAAGNDKLFCGALRGARRSGAGGRPAFRLESDSASSIATELVSLLRPLLAGRPTDDLLEGLRAAGVPASPVLDVGEVASHEQTLATGMLQELGGQTIVAPPLSARRRTAASSQRPAAPRRAHRRDPARGRLRRDGDRAPRSRRRDPRERLHVTASHGEGNRPARYTRPGSVRPSSCFRATRATGDERVEVDSGVDPFPFEQVDDVLGRDVARSPGERTGSRRARRRTRRERGAGFERRKRRRVARVARVVAVEPDRLPSPAHAVDERDRRPGVATPFVSPSISRRRPRERAGELEDSAGSTSPSNGQPNATLTVTGPGAVGAATIR